MAKNIEIRNSTAEFLIFMLEGKEDGIQVMYKDETIWCTQKAMAQLFDCSTDNIGLHLKNIYESGELMQDATTEYFSAVQVEGGRRVNRKLKFYNLDAIISVGYQYKFCSCHAVPAVVYVCTPAVCHPWICA